MSNWYPGSASPLMQFASEEGNQRNREPWDYEIMDHAKGEFGDRSRHNSRQASMPAIHDMDGALYANNGYPQTQGPNLSGGLSRSGVTAQHIPVTPPQHSSYFDSIVGQQYVASQQSYSNPSTTFGKYDYTHNALRKSPYSTNVANEITNHSDATVDKVPLHVPYTDTEWKDPLQRLGEKRPTTSAGAAKIQFQHHIQGLSLPYNVPGLPDTRDSEHTTGYDPQQGISQTPFNINSTVADNAAIYCSPAPSAHISPRAIPNILNPDFFNANSNPLATSSQSRVSNNQASQGRAQPTNGPAFNSTGYNDSTPDPQQGISQTPFNINSTVADNAAIYCSPAPSAHILPRAIPNIFNPDFFNANSNPLATSSQSRVSNNQASQSGAQPTSGPAFNSTGYNDSTPPSMTEDSDASGSSRYKSGSSNNRSAALRGGILAGYSNAVASIKNFPRANTETQSRCGWDNCNMVIDNSSRGLVKHILEVHDTDTTVSGLDVNCRWGTCNGTTYSGGTSFVKHIRGTHLRLEDIICPYCGVVIANGVSPTRKHMLRQHKDIQLLK
ncbi:hypothetical protein JR316_0007492 [Psilocybe cubensis]|uniref:C2H2-type domain-containing protein n=2 Tax=Psilocybe cubensis TaxID=181762 RepID=A0A8H7XT26_PSICU|nr:hypothetical protein JR316_0007492 [Psilocybe cubensis]KAH9480890.1 hypothetical protein JR316_0007492 [Psilocybe cubensis]